MITQKFLIEVRRLFRVAFVQKAVVMVLRAAWIGGAVYIFCWGSHQLWGWFPHQNRWIIYAAVSSALVLGSLLRHPQPNRGFVWRVDQTFELDEQVYTAYERIGQLGSQADQDAGTQMLLESEAVARLPRIRRRIVGRNWQFQREIESTVVVLILLLIIYLAGIGNIDRILPGSGFGFLPPVPSEPQVRDVFRSGIPGDESNPEEGGEPESESQSSSASFDLSPICDPNLILDQAAWHQTQDLLTQLGERLCCGSATLVLSEALKYQDYPAARDQFSVMAEKIVSYSDETRGLLADQFLASSVEFQQIGQPQISEVFSTATSALLGDSYPDMAEGLDGLSVLMQQFEQQQRCMTIADWQPGGQMLPAPPGTNPNDLSIFSGSVDFFPPDSSGIDPDAPVSGAESGLPSYEVPMEDADVVSSYFSPD